MFLLTRNPTITKIIPCVTPPTRTNRLKQTTINRHTPYKSARPSYTIMTILKELLHQSKIQTIFNNSIAKNLQSIDENCRGKGLRSYIGLWASPGTIDESEERQIVVKGSPVKVS